MLSDNTDILIYADGAASPNPGPGGYGVILVQGGRRVEFSGGYRMTTNNRMELMGVIAGLEALSGGRCRAAVYTDSRYVADMMNGGHAAAWRRNGWRRNKGKDPALNPDLWQRLLELTARHEVRFIWVRGHAEHPENTRCDALAVAARQRCGLRADDGYERPPAPLRGQDDLPGLFP